ncbi:MAG: LPS translocon maturation chaperone LptM [bacterium]
MTVLTLILLASGITACGTKGPLYLPDKAEPEQYSDN